MAFNEADSAVKSITSLRRGLEVLHAVEAASAISLVDLHRQTGIPKASLLRILKTLQQAGRVVRDSAEGRYQPAPSGVDEGQAAAWRDRLSALATGARATLQRRVPWPVDMGVREGTAMLILDIDRPINGLAVNYRALGFRPPMLMSSLGRCYLAFCPEGERREILAALALSPLDVNREARRPETVRRWIAHAHTLGYVLRDPSSTSLYSPDRFGAFSVPVYRRGRVIACLSCAWLPAVTSAQAVISANLGHMQAAARSIGERADAAPGLERPG